MLSFFRNNVVCARNNCLDVNLADLVLAAGACRPLPLAALVCSLFSASAVAGPNDALQAYVGLAYSYDDNLLRVPDGDPGFGGVRADSSRQAVAGLVFDKTYSRQVITAQAKLTKVKFNHFTELDYDGKDLQANWGWHIGNHLEGHLGATYAQVLAPYTDIRTSERNLRVQQREFFDGVWRFHPSWQVRGAVSKEKFSYDLPSQAILDRADNVGEAGVDYLAKSGSTVGLQLRKIKGRYDNLRRLGTIVVDDSYDQDEAKLRVLWTASGVTQVQFLGGWARRTHAFFTDRDSSGVNARLTANWLPTGKVRMSGAVWREFTAAENGFVSYSLNNGVSAGATWSATGKIDVDAQARYEKRKYQGLLATNSTLDFSDSIRTSSLGLTYAPARAIQLSARVYREARFGAAAFGIGNYHATGAVISANAQF